MQRDIFDSLSPVDYRYYVKKVADYFSENAFTKFKFAVEMALVKVLQRRGICSETVVQEADQAGTQVTTDDVYQEERRVGHDIRALVNCLRAKVSDAAKPYIHMTATSYDIIDSANAARYKLVVENVLIPALLELERVLIALTLQEAATVQIGRTHGQHAVPITFGFAIAGYVSRLGNCIENLKRLAQELPGKFSGAVGAYNASHLFFQDPEKFEEEVLAELGLKPAEHSTQIVPPEALCRLLYEVVLVTGVLANLSDDMRHLQRTEIGEVGEEFDPNQVGSSTMPQKRNPINFENGKSIWKIVMPRIITVLLDQLSEHQRDLTNSASSRTHGEILTYAVSVAERLTKAMSKLKVDHESLKRNRAMQGDLIAAEPLYIILAALGHPDAHEKVKALTLQAQREKRTLASLIGADQELMSYWYRMSAYQQSLINSPQLYSGIASQKAWRIANRWKDKLGL